VSGGQARGRRGAPLHCRRPVSGHRVRDAARVRRCERSAAAS